MATVPPPYSQRDAEQAQRYYLRSQRRPSVVGPAVLITAGIVALLVETNQLSFVHAWEWYMRWWPLLLIGVGLLSLGEWWFDRARVGMGRRSHGGLITLILLLAVGGYVGGYTSHGLRSMHLFGHREEGDDLFAHLLGQEHDADQSINEPIPSGSLVDINIPRGDVTITASGDDQIHVQSHQTVYAANDREGRRKLDALTPKLTVNGQQVTLRTADTGEGRADLTIELPSNANPTVNAGHGDVTVEGLRSAVTITAGKGDVKVDNIANAVHARMGKGTFTAQAITGELVLSGRLDDVNISEVQGPVSLDGEFFEETHVAHVQSNVHFHSSRSDVEAVKLPGDLEIDSDNLQLNNATGPIKVTTSAKDVECTGISGDLRVEDGDGDISVGVVAPLGSLDVHNRNGAITLTVPPTLGFLLQATARNGDIDAKLELPVSESGDSHTMSGSVGKGGPRFNLTADHGDISISRVETPPAPPEPPESAEPPNPPAPPAPPAPPEGHTRHFHPSHGEPPHSVSQ